MSGQHSPADLDGHDPHTHHQLIEGPTRLDIHHYMGICKCGQQFRGISAEDIFTRSQLHINRHNPEMNQ